MGIRAIGVVLAGAMAFGCEAPPDDVVGFGDVGFGDATFVGTVTGSDAVVGIVIEGDQVGAYTCGGDEDLMEHTEWFMGTAHIIDARSAWIDCGDTSFTFVLAADGTAEGFFVDIDGSTWDWTARPTRPDTIAGLYRAFDPMCSTGAIVIQDAPGDVPFVQGAWCDGAGEFRQVVPMEPVQLTEQGIEVEIPFDEPERVFVERVAF